jgi:hypothetical protein
MEDYDFINAALEKMKATLPSITAVNEVDTVLQLRPGKSKKVKHEVALKRLSGFEYFDPAVLESDGGGEKELSSALLRMPVIIENTLHISNPKIYLTYIKTDTT